MVTLGEVPSLATLRGAIMGKISCLWVFRLLENAFTAIEHLRILSDTDAYTSPQVHILLCKYFYTIVCYPELYSQVAIYMVIVKLYFTRGSRIQIACQRLSNIEFSATKVNGFQCRAIATESSILDIAGVPDPPLITIFSKVTFNLTQQTVILFNLIAIQGRSYL